MNIRMVPKELLDKIAEFPVANLMEEKHEITLLGEDFQDARSFTHKEFWKGYRKWSKVEHIA